MQKLVNQSKTFLIVISVSLLSACSQIPEFPEWNPKFILPSANKVFKCKLINKDEMTFECEDASYPFVAAEMDKHFCITMEEQQAIIGWAKDVKDKWEKTCHGR